MMIWLRRSRSRSWWETLPLAQVCLAQARSQLQMLNISVQVTSCQISSSSSLGWAELTAGAPQSWWRCCPPSWLPAQARCPCWRPGRGRRTWRRGQRSKPSGGSAGVSSSGWPPAWGILWGSQPGRPCGPGPPGRCPEAHHPEVRLEKISTMQFFCNPIFEMHANTTLHSPPWRIPLQKTPYGWVDKLCEALSSISSEQEQYWSLPSTPIWGPLYLRFELLSCVEIDYKVTWC